VGCCGVSREWGWAWEVGAANQMGLEGVGGHGWGGRRHCEPIEDVFGIWL